MSDMKTLVVMPTYNEYDSLPKTVGGVLGATSNDVHVLVVDDASPDGTGKIADGLRTRNADRVHVLHRAEKTGLGSAYCDGFRFAIDNGYDVICEMDADGSHLPADLPRLLEVVERGADVAIGSRRIRGGSVEGWGLHRHLMSWGAMTLARLLLRLKTKDVTAGFRCYRSPVIRELLKNPIMSGGYAFQEEALYRCEKGGFAVVEVPVVFSDRKEGRSKLSRRDIREFFVTMWRLWREKG